MSGAVRGELFKVGQQIWQRMVQSSGFVRNLEKVTITDVGDGSCTAEFKVDEGFTNRLGTLHGGCTATLVDCITSIGLLAGQQDLSVVSVNISVNYLRAATIGTTVEITSKTVKFGKTLAFMEAILKNKDTGKILATGSHVMFIKG